MLVGQLHTGLNATKGVNMITMSSLKLLQCRTCGNVFFFDSDAAQHEIEHEHRGFIEMGLGAETKQITEAELDFQNLRR